MWKLGKYQREDLKTSITLTDGFQAWTDSIRLFCYLKQSNVLTRQRAQHHFSCFLSILVSMLIYHYCSLFFLVVNYFVPPRCLIIKLTQHALAHTSVAWLTVSAFSFWRDGSNGFRSTDQKNAFQIDCNFLPAKDLLPLPSSLEPNDELVHYSVSAFYKYQWLIIAEDMMINGLWFSNDFFCSRVLLIAQQILPFWAGKKYTGHLLQMKVLLSILTIAGVWQAESGKAGTSTQRQASHR